MWTVVKDPQKPVVLSLSLDIWNVGTVGLRECLQLTCPAIALFCFQLDLRTEETFLCLPELNFMCQPFWSLLCILNACILQAVLGSIPKNIVIFRFYPKEKHKTFYYWGWTQLSAQCRAYTDKLTDLRGPRVQNEHPQFFPRDESKIILDFGIKMSLAQFSHDFIRCPTFASSNFNCRNVTPCFCWLALLVALIDPAPLFLYIGFFIL